MTFGAKRGLLGSGLADQRSVWRKLPSGSRKLSSEGLGALLEKIGLPGQPVRRGVHRASTDGVLDRVKKGALNEGQTILFADQFGFYMLPAVVRSHAPVGQILVLHEQFSHAHLPAMSAIALEGKLLMTELVSQG